MITTSQSALQVGFSSIGGDISQFLESKLSAHAGNFEYHHHCGLRCGHKQTKSIIFTDFCFTKNDEMKFSYHSYPFPPTQCQIPSWRPLSTCNWSDFENPLVTQVTAKIVHAAWYHWILSFLLERRDWSDFFLWTMPSTTLGLDSLATTKNFVEASPLECFFLDRRRVILGIGEFQKFWTF